MGAQLLLIISHPLYHLALVCIYHHNVWHETLQNCCQLGLDYLANSLAYHT